MEERMNYKLIGGLIAIVGGLFLLDSYSFVTSSVHTLEFIIGIIFATIGIALFTYDPLADAKKLAKRASDKWGEANEEQMTLRKEVAAAVRRSQKEVSDAAARTRERVRALAKELDELTTDNR